MRSLYVILWRTAHYEHVPARDLSGGERDFVEQNRLFWQEIYGRDGNRDGAYTLIEVGGNAYILHYIAAIGRMASQSQGTKPLAMVVAPSILDSAKIEILRSYGIRDYVNVRSWRFGLFLLLSYWLAWRTYRKMSSPDDLLRFKIDGIEFGDILYDKILHDGYSTVSAVDERVHAKLQTFYLNRFIFKATMRKYRIRRAILSHSTGLRSGVWMRYLLNRGVEVIYCRCVAMTNIRKYRHIDEARIDPVRPEAKYVDYMLGKELDRVMALADEYLERRFYQGAHELDISFTFDPRNRTFLGREEFAQQYGLDPSKKNAFVMLHAFRDDPHAYGVDSIVYRDYYEWFINTLRVARTVESVNWIFKEHPSAVYYPTLDLDLSDIFGRVTEPNIVFLDRNADFNARSLQFVADAVVTCIGTAGLEYAALGIPCILGAESHYSGFGFTIVEKTREQYERRLREIDRLPGLTDEQMRIAKIIMYFELSMAMNTPFFLMPSYDEYEKILRVNQKQFYEDAARVLRDLDRSKAIWEVKKIEQFVENDSFRQYIDFDAYDFMLGAIQ